MTENILAIGPILGKHPSQIGGTTKSFDALLRYLNHKNIPFRLIATNRFIIPGALIINAAYILILCIFLIPAAGSVMLNVNPRGALMLGPLLYLYTKLWRKPFFFRMFGGDLEQVYKAQGKWLKWLLRQTIFEADLVLLQTRALVKYFTPFCNNVKLLPTARDAHLQKPSTQKYSRKFVFIGLVCKEKGIEHILRFQREYGHDYLIDIYGPILDTQYQHIKQNSYYKGVIEPQDVISVLANYDVLLLPTFYPGEGYPGIIIEANSVGLPVISTHWLAIPELVINEKTGILVAPDNYTELVQAIKMLDERSFKKMSIAALQWSRQYESSKVYRELLEQIFQHHAKVTHNP